MLVFRGLCITLFRHWNAFVDMMFVGFWAGTLSRKRCGFRGEKRIRMWFHYFAKRHVYMWKMWWKYVLFWYLTIQVLGYICIYCTYIYIYIHMNHHFPVLYAIAAGTPPKKHHDKKSNIYSKMWISYEKWWFSSLPCDHFGGCLFFILGILMARIPSKTSIASMKPGWLRNSHLWWTFKKCINEFRKNIYIVCNDINIY